MKVWATRAVQFTEAAEMRDAEGNVSFSANPGDVLELREDQANRWVSRGRAVYFDATDDILQAEKAEEVVAVSDSAEGDDSEEAAAEARKGRGKKAG